MLQLRGDVSWLRICFFAFLPASWPLVGMTKLFERLRRSDDRSLEVLFGRSRLAQMMTHGYKEGVLSDRAESTGVRTVADRTAIGDGGR